MFEDLSDLLWPGGHSPHLDRRRAEAILLRVQAFALLFAVFTSLFIAVDAAFLEGEKWKVLAGGRLAASAGFLTLHLWSRGPPFTMVRARAALLVLFLIPVGFFLFAHQMLQGDPWLGHARILGAAYTFVPFLLACGIGAFPLTAVEACVIALFTFAAEAWFRLVHDPAPASFMAVEAFWLLFLIAAIAAFAAMSQVKLLTALVKQMIRDPLTACLRRESGAEILETQLALAARQEMPLAILFADLDHFKEVNDTFGHEVGDAVLAAAAQSLRNVLRDSDTLLRWGGEEFLVILPNTSTADATRIVERLGVTPVARLPDGRRMTISVGISELRKDQVRSVEALVGLADMRMYLAKQAGRNRYVSGDGALPVALAAAA